MFQLVLGSLKIISSEIFQESCRRKKRGIASIRMVMMGEPMETADLSSPELMDTGPTVRDTAWDWPITSASVWQSCLLVRLLTVRVGSLPGAWLAFGNLFPMMDYLAQPWCKGRSLVLHQFVVLCFVQAHGMPGFFWVEIGEDGMMRQVDGKG